MQDTKIYLKFDEYKSEEARARVYAVQYIYSSHVIGNVAEFLSIGEFSAHITAYAIDLSEKMWSYQKNTGIDGADREFHIYGNFFNANEVKVATNQESKITQHDETLALIKDNRTYNEYYKLCGSYISPNRVKLTDGPFLNSIKEKNFKKYYAFVKINCTDYKSTHDILTGLFSQHAVSEGAHFMLDGWNLNAASPDHGQRRAWREIVQSFSVHFSEIGPYGFLGNRLVVHSYA